MISASSHSEGLTERPTKRAVVVKVSSISTYSLSLSLFLCFFLAAREGSGPLSPVLEISTGTDRGLFEGFSC